MHNQYLMEVDNRIHFKAKQWLDAWSALPFLLITAFYIGTLPKREKPRLVWGCIPIINNSYWSRAMQKAGFESTTLMTTYAESINKKEDYDLYMKELVQFQQEVLESLTELLPKVENHSRSYLRKWWVLKWFPKWLKWIPRWLIKLGHKRYFKHLNNRLQKARLKMAASEEYAFDFDYNYFVFIYTLLNFDIFHFSMMGGYLLFTALAQHEAFFLKLANKKIVSLPFGGDSHRYSLYYENIFKHTLLLDYPLQARQEPEIKKRVEYWSVNADILMMGYASDGYGRWDVFPYSYLTIDMNLWQPKDKYSYNDGTNGPVKIMHTPNHRGVKGTQFILKAVEELKAEGLQIEMILLEKVQNSEVRRLMREEADIHVEQLIRGYALSGIEGMASGLPVLSTLGDDLNARAFRHYSYLNECPVLSATVESIKEELRVMITNPALREKLGRAGRLYVEKYHSDETCQYMFGAVYDKIWFDQNVDLLNLFNPMTSEFNHRKPFVDHPLINNRLPSAYFGSSQYHPSTLERAMVSTSQLGTVSSS